MRLLMSHGSQERPVSASAAAAGPAVRDWRSIDLSEVYQASYARQLAANSKNSNVSNNSSINNSSRQRCSGYAHSSLLGKAPPLLDHLQQILPRAAASLQLWVKLHHCLYCSCGFCSSSHCSREQPLPCSLMSWPTCSAALLLLLNSVVSGAVLG